MMKPPSTRRMFENKQGNPNATEMVKTCREQIIHLIKMFSMCLPKKDLTCCSCG